MRERTLDSRHHDIGTITNEVGDIIDSSGVTQGTLVTTYDVVGNFSGANRFSLLRHTREMPLMTGSRYNPYADLVDRYFNGQPIDAANHATPDPLDWFPNPSFYDLDQLTWKVLAESNPSQAHVSVPQVIGELKDIPSLVKDWGSSLLTTIPKFHLTTEWAVKPMISDAWKLYNFMKASQERLNQLKNLRDGKSIRKRVSLGSDQAYSETGMLLSSSQIWVTGTLKTVVTTEMWGSAQWILSSDANIPKMDDKQLELFARRLTGGMNVSGAIATTWELLPWSWLADWFGNVGDLIAASNNSIPLTYRNVCIMKRSKSTTTCDIDPVDANYTVSFSPQLSLVMERKERWPWSPVIPVPTPRIPVINGRKWSILASLAALRLPRSSQR